jgi:hypothetical protein
MSVFDYLRFYWPLLMVAFYLVVFGQRIKVKAQFFLFAALLLFGISKLMSTELLPLLVSVLPLGQENLMSKVSQLHWIFQAIAAIVGWFATTRLARYFQLNRQWNQKTKLWDLVEVAGD